MTRPGNHTVQWSLSELVQEWSVENNSVRAWQGKAASWFSSGLPRVLPWQPLASCPWEMNKAASMPSGQPLRSSGSWETRVCPVWVPTRQLPWQQRLRGISVLAGGRREGSPQKAQAWWGRPGRAGEGLQGMSAVLREWWWLPLNGSDGGEVRSLPWKRKILLSNPELAETRGGAKCFTFLLKSPTRSSSG